MGKNQTDKQGRAEKEIRQVSLFIDDWVMKMAIRQIEMLPSDDNIITSKSFSTKVLNVLHHFEKKIMTHEYSKHIVNRGHVHTTHQHIYFISISLR